MRSALLLVTASVTASVTALAACAGPNGDLTSPRRPGAVADATVTNGPTYVTGTYVKSVGGTGYTNTNPQGKGTCRAATGEVGSNGPVWYNPEGHATAANFCQAPSGGGGGATTVTCTFTATATFAENNNELLNFGVTQALGYNAVTNPTPDLYVHYNAEQPNATVGAGTLVFSGTCDNGSSDAVGTLDLTQFAGAGNIFTDYQTGDVSGWYSALSVAGIKVVIASHNYELTGLTWFYRSAVGS